tara:strand:+ start:269 stop:748 length:480 start_codon:yes stop_codon:yes gene_type:complete
MGARAKDLNPDIYIGLKLPMEMGPNGTFNQTKTALEQTRYNIINLLKTMKGERVGQPTFGSNIHKVLFEPMTVDVETQIEEEINASLAEWLPYVSIKDINFKHSHELDNQITISIIFSLSFEPDRFGDVRVDFDAFEDILLSEETPIIPVSHGGNQGGI